MLVVTDSSSIPGIKISENSLIGYPFIEAICVYYKSIANIDAYPIIIDFKQTKSHQDFKDTVNAIMPAFSCVEFFGVDKERVADFNSNNLFSFIGGDYESKKRIDSIFYRSKISSNLIYSAVIRAALDLQTYHSLQECLDYLIKYLFNNKDLLSESTSLYSLLVELVYQSADFLINKNKIINFKPDFVKQKFIKFLIEGKKAWVDEYPNEYLSNKKSINENSVLLHRRYRGVVETGSKIEVKDISMLDQLISWDNLEQISKLIQENPENIYKYSCKSNLGAIITNGTAILGFGDIGAVAGLPVMEGKCVLFKLFGGTNVLPMCIQEKDADKLIAIINRISPSFCAINLEDIKAPECFKIENSLSNSIPYPVFHDDQHGTAIVVSAAIINALRLSKKKFSDVKIVMNGAGAAGLSVTELLVTNGATNIIICDTNGAIYTGRPENMNNFKEKLAKLTNLNKVRGNLVQVLKGADIFIGVSAPKTLTKEMIKSMNSNPIIFALANPEPEIYPHEAKEAGAFIIATGRSDFPNQVNNSLAFPGIFRAVIDTRSTKISVEMKSAASKAIADLIPFERLTPEYIIPDSLDLKVPVAVANAVAKEAIRSGLATNKEIDQDHVEDDFLGWILEEKLRNWNEIARQNLIFKDNDLKPQAKY
jgi:malate dehydrogenase (oxaloacetate-decarboxylating)